MLCGVSAFSSRNYEVSLGTRTEHIKRKTNLCDSDTLTTALDLSIVISYKAMLDEITHKAPLGLLVYDDMFKCEVQTTGHQESGGSSGTPRAF